MQEPRTVIRFGTYEVNLRTGELRKNGTRVKLEQQPFRVLTLLLQHPGELVTREELKSKLWSSDTFVDFDTSLNTDIAKLREALGDAATNPRFVETIPRRGYRFVAPVEAWDRPARMWPGRRWKALVLVSAGLALIIAAVVFFYLGRQPVLKERDTVVLADFANSTGEPVFDDALKAGLIFGLEQSPFINVLPDARVTSTLQLMKHSPAQRLSRELAREICIRTGSQAVIAGSIAKLGNSYGISLRASDCQTDDSFASIQMEADSREHVLRSLGAAVTKLRGKLGESLASIQRFNKPLEEATTSSLEALRAFSLGRQEQHNGHYREAIGLYERATERDPKFAAAYRAAGMCYWYIGEPARRIPYLTKAFELRERVSERERYLISATYYSEVSREYDKAISTYQLYAESYPQDMVPHENLGEMYNTLGWLDKALPEFRKALELAPSVNPIYLNTAMTLIRLNRYDEAAAVLQQGVEKKVLSGPYGWFYGLAFVRGDRAGMDQWAAKARGTPAELNIVFRHAEIKAFGGQLRQARDLYQEAVKRASAAGKKGQADDWLVAQASVEAEFGNFPAARAILSESHARSVIAAIVRAQTGDLSAAKSIADEHAKLGILIEDTGIPMISAAIALQRGKPGEALEALRPAAPYDLCYTCGFRVLHLRGYAHLRNGNAQEAATDFQRVLENRGLGITSPLYPLAYVGLARARALAGDAGLARKAYEQFFTLWKDADPDIPILRQAKAEYAKLK